MTARDQPAANWFARMYHEIRRDRHVLLHGNIDDLVLWNDEFQPLPVALSRFLAVAGFAASTRYDLVDGITYADDASREFVTRRLDTAHHAGTPLPAPPPPTPTIEESARGRRVSAAEQRLRARVDAATNPTVRTPADLLAAARILLVQEDRACAVVIDQADLIFGREAAAEDQYQMNLACLRKMITEGRHAPGAGEAPLRNTVVMVAKQAGTLPDWIHRDNPHVATITVPHPTSAERGIFVRRRIRDFWHAELPTAQEYERSAAALSTLTEGMTLRDIAALAATSHLARIAPSAPRRLVMRHRFGLRDDPWERLDSAKVLGARDTLAGRVIGQPAAVNAVADMLVNARIGVDFVADPDGPAHRPKGVFFFVGPTGVGKTELAKAIAELVFEDESALRRFDMSEYSQEHASERLTGAPPGYVGHENGGALTNWIIERPFSVVLFDEIEKADPRIFDKFLQIIDDGRLTDGQGRTAHFSQSVVIFTSNLGASGLTRRLLEEPTELPDYPAVRRHFEDAVTDYLSNRLGRPELLGRLGDGIVVFDILRHDVVTGIVAKFLRQLAQSGAARGFSLSFDEHAVQEAVAVELNRTGLALGARQIRNPLLEQWVRRPLNRWIIEHAPAPGTRLRIAGQEPPFAVHVSDADHGARGDGQR